MRKKRDEARDFKNCWKVEKARSFNFRCVCISRKYQLDFSNVRELCEPGHCLHCCHEDDLCFCC